MDVSEVISSMSLEEKVMMCSGKDAFSTQDIPRLGVPSISFSDGPHGVRKQKRDSDFLGIHKSEESTCYPTAASLACSFDREMLHKVGESLGIECREKGVSVLLGPAVNIKRSPLCGRNFEYFSEDPFLTSELAKSYILGVQEQGIGTSIKHFAVNNQEELRLSIDARVEERALREVYLAAFEKAIIDAHPWTVMCAYNKVNGEYCSENFHLLKEILRDEWGFDGLVVSDWGAVADRVAALNMGLDLEMPPSGKENDKKLLEAIDNGQLDITVLDESVMRLLSLIQKTKQCVNGTSTQEERHALAKEAARDSIVLLKNEDRILPLDKQKRVAVVGSMAKEPRFQGAGSSHVNPTLVDDILVKIAEKTTDITYSCGYSLYEDKVDDELIAKSKEVAAHTDYAIVFVGLPSDYESEGYDRTHMRLPDSHVRLISEIASVQPNIVVVLGNGSPVEMPWIGKVKGLMETYLGGEAVGAAIADLIFGDYCPSGKLAETFPVKLSDNPSYISYPGEKGRVEYREGLFVGYRYYDKKELKPLFPFGFGLSYTEFQYEGLTLSKETMREEETLEVSVNVRNIGKMAGKEIVQIYISKPDSKVIRPVRELKGFDKVLLLPGEEKTIKFELNKRSFAYYSPEEREWVVENGEYTIAAASSSQDIRLTKKVEIVSKARAKVAYTRYSTIGELLDDPGKKAICDEVAAYLRREGAVLHNLQDNAKMGEEMVKGMALCSVYTFSNGTFTEDNLQDVLRRLNK